MEADIAAGLGLKIGDAITLNVSAATSPPPFDNLRKVNWRSFAINFVFVFSPTLRRAAVYGARHRGAAKRGGRKAP